MTHSRYNIPARADVDGPWAERVHLDVDGHHVRLQASKPLLCLDAFGARHVAKTLLAFADLAEGKL